MVKRTSPPRKSQSARQRFYLVDQKDMDLADLDQLSADLSNEIITLRVATRKLWEAMSSQDISLETYADSISVLGKCFSHIARLMRTNQALTGGPGNTLDVITTEISRALEDLRKK